MKYIFMRQVGMISAVNAELCRSTFSLTFGDGNKTKRGSEILF